MSTGQGAEGAKVFMQRGAVRACVINYLNFADLRGGNLKFLRSNAPHKAKSRSLCMMRMANIN